MRLESKKKRVNLLLLLFFKNVIIKMRLKTIIIISEVTHIGQKLHSK